MNNDSTMYAGSAYARVTAALSARGSRRCGSNWQCPAHDDRTPSLSVHKGDKGAVMRCHAGCATEDVVQALGLTMTDLFDEQYPDTPGSSQKRTEFLVSLAGVKGRAEAYGWGYRGGRSDRDMFLCAVIPIMERSGKYTVAVSQREASELAGVSNFTASRSLTRLVEKHILREEPPRERTRVFSLNPLLRDLSFLYVASKTSSTSTYKNDSSRNTLAPTELGVRLGKAATAVYCALTAKPQTVTEIALKAGVHKSTASRALREKLSRPELAELSGDKWVRGPADPAAYDPQTDGECGPVVASALSR